MARSCASEEEFRTRILGLIGLEDRVCRELWHDSATRKHPMEWVMGTFKAVNNGRLKDVPLPRSIDLLIPEFGHEFGELQISVVDTKGVDDVAVREDLDARLKDSRSALVLCSRFNDAPALARDFSLSICARRSRRGSIPGRSPFLLCRDRGKLRATKDDTGELALMDAEGYEFKRMQVASELAADDLAGVPMMFFNVESDDPKSARTELFNQLNRMRKSIGEQLLDLCAAVQEVIENQERQAIIAAIEEVASRLNSFLEGNRRLGAREELGILKPSIPSREYATPLHCGHRLEGAASITALTWST